MKKTQELFFQRKINQLHGERRELALRILQESPRLQALLSEDAYLRVKSSIFANNDSQSE